MSGHTLGPCSIHRDNAACVVSADGYHVADTSGAPGAWFCATGRPQRERIANAALIVEAFNVATETGLTPRQLAEQRAELLEALQAVLRIDLYTLPQQDAAAYRLARAAIQKATGGQ